MPSLRIGNFTDRCRPTGCTVILTESADMRLYQLTAQSDAFGNGVAKLLRRCV